MAVVLTQPVATWRLEFGVFDISGSLMRRRELDGGGMDKKGAD